MSEATLWLIYLSGAVPAYLLRRSRHANLWVCCAVAGLWSLAIWLPLALRDGIDLNEKWSIVGLGVAFQFGAVAGLAGAGAAIWRE